jgi:hypothetical protein
MDFDLAGTGGRPVKLAIHLTLTQGGRGGRTRVQGNQFTLSDGSGAQICQGRLTAMDSDGFTARCQDTGGTALQIDATFAHNDGTQVDGDLDVAPLQP